MNPLNFGPISFPSFGIEVDPGRALTLGPATIHYYALCIVLGLVLAVMYASRRSKEFGVTEDDILDGVLWILRARRSLRHLPRRNVHTVSRRSISRRPDAHTAHPFWRMTKNDRQRKKQAGSVVRILL